MKMLDTYLKAVRRNLPDSQREDIIQELSENIRAQFEDREAQLGRPLSDADQAAILKQHGHPLAVAARYRKDQGSLTFGRQLIGPLLFPLYSKVLAINLGISFIVLCAIYIGLVMSGRPTTFATVAALFFHLLAQFAIVTLIFTVAQSHLTRFPDRWDPGAPDRLFAPGAPAQMVAPHVPRFESLAQVVMLWVFLVFLEGIRHATDVWSDLAAAGLKPGPVWGQIYWPIRLLFMVGIAQAVANLLRPDWTKMRAIVRVAGGLAWTGIIILLAQAGEWIVIADAASPAVMEVRQKLPTINQWLYYNLLVAVVVSVVCLAFDVRNLMRERRRRVSLPGDLAVIAVALCIMLHAPRPYATDAANALAYGGDTICSPDVLNTNAYDASIHRQIGRAT